MQLSNAFILACCVNAACGGINFTEPKRGANVAVGTILVRWEEDDMYPKITDFASYVLQLMLGGNDWSNTLPLVTLSDNGTFEAGNNATGTVQAYLAGPTINGFYLMLQARLKRRTDDGTVITATYYSPRFSFPEMIDITPTTYEEGAKIAKQLGGTDGPEPVFYPVSAFALVAPTTSASTTPTSTRSATATIAAPMTTARAKHRESPFSKRRKAGIGTGAACGMLLALWAIIWYWRRRMRRREEKWTSTGINDDKAELSANNEATTKLDRDQKPRSELQEAGGKERPAEADACVTRAELESDWTGWEAPALLEVELSRPQRVLR